MVVKVTQKHIDEGLVRDCADCPVARAISELVRPGVFVGVGPDDVLLQDEAAFAEIYLPQQASAFINAFDHLYECDPFEFELDIPEAYLR